MRYTQNASSLCRLKMARIEDRRVRECAKMMGLAPEFTQDELRKAYLRGCKKLAPDKGGDQARFLAMQDAYAFLKKYARRREVDLSGPIPQRPEPVALTAAPEKGRRHKDVNAAFQALHGQDTPTLRGRGEWLRSDVPESQRPPERISESRLNETFESINRAQGRGPMAVSTHVVKPCCAFTTVGYDIEDSTDDFTIGNLPDLQRAYGGAL